MRPVDTLVDRLAGQLTLGGALDELRANGGYVLVDHWQQGEFHHDVVVRSTHGVFVIATNCNGGVKEVLAFEDVPDRGGLWKLRCPSNPEFQGVEPEVKARATTVHWFDPCALLSDDARSEYRAEHRERQAGGGWQCSTKKG